MDYQTLDALKQNHPAWRLLRADNTVLIASFLYRTFIKPNVRTLPESELVLQFEDYLHHLHHELGEGMFPRGARAYLDDWASDKHAWLRKYYVPESDEPNFDITSATEQAIDWIAGLSQRPFIGTESRLLIVFELLRQLTERTETDPQARIAELERRRTEIDTEIAQIRKGELPLIDATGIRERFLQIAGTAQALLSDFRKVDQNFRDLDRAARERITVWDGNKGDLLTEIFGERDAISDSDQGRSFQAFWDFLMSPARQEELSSLLKKVMALDAVQVLEPDRRLLRIHYDWLAAGEMTQRTIARLSAELRRYLDDKAWLENRRIMGILREVESRALEIRDRLPGATFMALDDMKPAINLVMDRPLFNPPQKPELDDAFLSSFTDDIPADALFEQTYVNRDRLADHIRRALQGRTQVSLSEIIEDHPLEQGLAELVAYLRLASDDTAALIDDSRRQTILWVDGAGCLRRATLPLVIFARTPADTEARKIFR